MSSLPKHITKVLFDENNDVIIDYLLELLINNETLSLSINEVGNQLNAKEKVSEILQEKSIELNHHKNHFRHKLIRIREEFQFVKNNSKQYQKLTKREKQIISLLAEGFNNPEIAKLLFISRHTVEQHRKNINHKLQIKSVTNLMRFVYAFDLL